LGKYKSSLEVAKDVEKLNDRDHEISYIFGKIYLAMGNKKEAINRFRAVIAKEVSE
jgi:lipoprotein NlpI